MLEHSLLEGQAASLFFLNDYADIEGDELVLVLFSARVQLLWIDHFGWVWALP